MNEQHKCEHRRTTVRPFARKRTLADSLYALHIGGDPDVWPDGDITRCILIDVHTCDDCRESWEVHHR